MTREVVVYTGSRLHFGPLSHGAAAGRYFGGVGTMIDDPGCALAVRHASQDELSGPAQAVERAARLLERYRRSPLGNRAAAGYQVQMSEVIPAHGGFGSGTQFNLALARAVTALDRPWPVDVHDLAALTGRGARSALGIHGFEQGGFLVEAGKEVAEAVSPLVARVEFPAAWRWLLITPEDSAGLSGEREIEAFQQLPPMPDATTGRLCQIALMQVLPSLVEQRFDAFSEALFEFGRTVGEYFAPVQGGVYADPRMACLAEALRRRGLHGVGQTSWGPTLFALCKSTDEAREVAGEIEEDERYAECVVRIAKGLNRGAMVSLGEGE